MTDPWNIGDPLQQVYVTHCAMLHFAAEAYAEARFQKDNVRLLRLAGGVEWAMARHLTMILDEKEAYVREQSWPTRHNPIAFGWKVNRSALRVAEEFATAVYTATTRAAVNVWGSASILEKVAGWLTVTDHRKLALAAVGMAKVSGWVHEGYLHGAYSFGPPDGSPLPFPKPKDLRKWCQQVKQCFAPGRNGELGPWATLPEFRAEVGRLQLDLEGEYRFAKSPAEKAEDKPAAKAELVAMTANEQAFFDVLTGDGQTSTDIIAKLSRDGYINFNKEGLSRMSKRLHMRAAGVRHRKGAGYYRVQIGGNVTAT